MDCDDIGDDLHEFMDNLKLNSNFKYAERDMMNYLSNVPENIINWYYDNVLYNLIIYDHVEYHAPEVSTIQLFSIFMKNKIKEHIAKMLTQKTTSYPTMEGINIENYFKYGALWLNYEAIKIIKDGYTIGNLFGRDIFSQNLILNLKNDKQCEKYFLNFCDDEMCSEMHSDFDEVLE